MRTPLLVGWLLAAALAALASVLLVAALDGGLGETNLLINGGFEDGDTSWNVLGGDLGIVEVSADPSLVHEGDRAALLTVDGRLQAYQDVTVPPGATYQLSGWAIVDDPGVVSVLLEISWHQPGGGFGQAPSPPLGETGGIYQPMGTRVALIPCDAFGVRVSVIVVANPGASDAHVYVDALHLKGAPPKTPCPALTPSPTATALPTVTASPTATPVNTPTPQSSPVPAATPTPSPTAPAGVTPAPTSPPTPPPLPTPGPGLLVNGGFEVSDGAGPLGWRTNGGLLGQVTAPVHNGGRAGVFFSVSTSTKWVYQTVAVTPMAWYEFAAYVYHDDPWVEAAFLRISWYASADGSGSAVVTVDSTALLDAPAAGYRHLTTGPVQAPPGVQSANARILLRPRSDVSSLIYIDDALFSPSAPPPTPTPTPPPATPTLTPQPAPSPTPTPFPSAQPSTATPGPQPAPEATATPSPVASVTATPLLATLTPSPAPLAAAPPGELLVNGGFEVAEDGRPLAWLSHGGVLMQTDAPVRSGRAAAGFFSSSSSTKWVYQTVAVSPTDWYELEGYIYLGDALVQTSLLRVSWYTSTDGSGSAVTTVDSTALLEEPDASYRRLTTGPVQAPPGVHSANARVLLRPRSEVSALIYVDDVSFRPVAAPIVPAEPPPEVADQAPVASAASSSSGSRSNSGTASDVLGASSRSDAPTPMPSPVIRRSSPLLVEDAPSSSSGGTLWWLLVPAGVALAAGTAFWWQASQRGGGGTRAEPPRSASQRPVR